MDKHFDAIIIGGGASGLCCAISAMQKHPKMKIAIIEKNDRVGKKLLSTGNGRCNLSNKNISPDKYTGSFKKQSEAVFNKYDTNKLLDFFGSLGLLTYCDSEGRYYPISKQASSVLDVLRFSCERLGVQLFCGERIKRISKTRSGFMVMTENSDFSSEKLVIACGSKASPKLGGSASSADYLKNLGHTVVSFSPALCPIKVKSELIRSLKGIRATGIASLENAPGQAVKTEIGEIQFGENALSGICIFNLSLYSKKSDTISLDLLNNISERELFYILQRNKDLFANMTVDNIFTGIFQKRLALAILKQTGVTDFGKFCSALSEKELKILSHTAKNMRFAVEGNSDFEQAQCALGGALGKEIDENTMQSKICKNLYICGETVDICGECGGYNLHFAFSSGIIAGENL